MWGLIIGVSLGVLLLVFGVAAWREGRLGVGERGLERGERAFPIVVGLLIVAGVGMGVASVIVAWRLERGEAVAVQHDRVSLTLPHGWTSEPELAAMLSTGSMRAAAYTAGGDELLISWPSEPQPSTMSLEETMAALRDPSIAYERWEVSGSDGQLLVDMEYPSPRGKVVARVIAAQAPTGLWLVTAMCSYGGDASRCRSTVGSVALR